jgi:hypothetical protein
MSDLLERSGSQAKDKNQLGEHLVRIFQTLNEQGG